MLLYDKALKCGVLLMCNSLTHRANVHSSMLKYMVYIQKKMSVQSMAIMLRGPGLQKRSLPKPSTAPAGQ